MTRTAGAQIGCQRPSRFWGLGCPKIYHEAEDTLDQGKTDLQKILRFSDVSGRGNRFVSCTWGFTPA
ncbi:hypothetical protein [Thiolapillus sp.]|uniref:hypothetical protein n=1 Tax=Thiolapillus sp. TaxID=2017437 RepID=UPI00263B6E62|nr:hypothetical protein [Thiolapillus sp.]